MSSFKQSYAADASAAVNSGGSTAQGLHPPHGLQGLQAFLAAHGLQGLQDFFAAQGLHGPQAFFAAQGLAVFFAAQGLHDWRGAQPFLPAHGLHAPQLFLTAQGLNAACRNRGTAHFSEAADVVQGLQAPHGLHRLAALHGLQPPHGLHGLAAPHVPASRTAALGNDGRLPAAFVSEIRAAQGP